MKIIQLEAAHANIDMIELREKTGEQGELLWWLQCLVVCPPAGHQTVYPLKQLRT